MKSIKFNSLLLITFVVFTSVFTSCKKDYEASKPTFLPNVSLKGDDIIVVVKGDAYNELGATATENGNEIDYTISGIVDITIPGLYTLDYLALNQDGFSASASRTVFVIPGPVTDDVSYITGDYNTPGGTTPETTNSSITKIAPGVYYTENCWGNGSLAVLPAYFFCVDGVTLEIPLQGAGNSAVRTLDGAPGTYDIITNTISWKVERPFFSSGPLYLQKTWIKL